MLLLMPPLNGLYAAAVVSFNASCINILDTRFRVMSSFVALECINAPSQSQFLYKPRKPCKKR